MREGLDAFFAANQEIVLFVYGQVFFVLGMAIALQSWRHSRLALARSLKWLAAFGFSHSLHEWGYIFIPVQTQYLPSPLIVFLVSVQAILLALSFTCLLQFGIETIRPLSARWHLARYLPAGLLLAWLYLSFGLVLLPATSFDAWYPLVTLLARYGIGLPGALMAAYGLRHAAYKLIDPLRVVKTVQMLRLASFALVGYALLAGLVVPAADSFPAHWLNETVVWRLTGVPVPVLRSLLGLILIIAIIRALDVFNVEIDRQLAIMEETQLLLAERERIGRELHDGTLQTIYAAGLLLNRVRQELAKMMADLLIERVQQSIDLLDEAVSDIRHYIGELRPQPDNRSLVNSLQELAKSHHLRSLVEVNFVLELPDDRVLSPVQVRHLLAIANEALSNIVRHAQATRVEIVMCADAQKLLLRIEDNGRGFSQDYVIGYGMQNMRERALLLGGTIQINSQPKRHTVVQVEVPWSQINEPLAPVDRG